MSSNLQRVKDILADHNYVVRVVGDGEKCVLNLPVKKIGDITCDEALSCEYILSRGDNSHIRSVSDSLPDKRFTMAEYAMRPFLIVQFRKLCSIYNYDWNLVRYYDDNMEEKGSLAEIVNPPSEKDGQTKESFLSDILLSALKYGFSDQHSNKAKKFDVESGFDLIKDLAGGN